MYQLRTVENRKIVDGVEIQVIGDLCRVETNDNRTLFAGNYDACKKWLKDKGMLAPVTIESEAE